MLFQKVTDIHPAVCSGLFSRNSKNGTGSKRTCSYTRAAENQCEVEKRISTKKSISTISHPTSNEPSTFSFGNESVNSGNLENVNSKSKKHREPKSTSTITRPNSNVLSSA